MSRQQDQSDYHTSLSASIPAMEFQQINPYLPSGLFLPYQIEESISKFTGVFFFFFVLFCFFISFKTENLVSKQCKF